MNDTIDYQIVTEHMTSVVNPQLRGMDGLVPTWNFIVILVAIAMLLLNKQFFTQRFRAMITMFVQPSDAQKMTREWNPVTSLNGLSIVIVYIALMALILQKTVLAFTGKYMLYGSLDFYFDICVYIAAYLVVQYLVATFVGWLFGFEAATSHHEVLHLSAAAVLDIVTVVLSMVVIFYPFKGFLVFSLIIIGLITVVRLVKTFFEVQILSKMNLYKNFLYFCALEIIPVSIAVTMVMRLIVSGCVL